MQSAAAYYGVDFIVVDAVLHLLRLKEVLHLLLEVRVVLVLGGPVDLQVLDHFFLIVKLLTKLAD